MKTMNEALRLANDGVKSMTMADDRVALNQLLTSLRIMKTALFDSQENEQTQVRQSSSDRDPSFHSQQLPGLCTSSSSPFLCSQAVGFTDAGMHRMLTEWRDSHICSAIATFNAALLHHQQGVRWNDCSDNIQKRDQWFEKAKSLYKLSHSLIVESNLSCQDIRHVAWYLKISTIYNLSHIYRTLGDDDASLEGFQYLAWIVHIASPEICQQVLGDALYEQVLENSLLFSLSIISAPSA